MVSAIVKALVKEETITASIEKFVKSQAKKEVREAAQQSVIWVLPSLLSRLENPSCQRMSGNHSALSSRKDAGWKVVYLNPDIMIHGRGDDPLKATMDCWPLKEWSGWKLLNYQCFISSMWRSRKLPTTRLINYMTAPIVIIRWWRCARQNWPSAQKQFWCYSVLFIPTR